jgi:hypothetical protein
MVELCNYRVRSRFYFCFGTVERSELWPWTASRKCISDATRMFLLSPPLRVRLGWQWEWLLEKSRFVQISKMCSREVFCCILLRTVSRRSCMSPVNWNGAVEQRDFAGAGAEHEKFAVLHLVLWVENILREIIPREISRIFFLLVIKHR